jgi:hypothetical protein
LPDEKKICLTLSDGFADDMTKAEEKEMCEGLNNIIWKVISYFCDNYSKILFYGYSQR